MKSVLTNSATSQLRSGIKSQIRSQSGSQRRICLFCHSRLNAATNVNVTSTSSLPSMIRTSRSVKPDLNPRAVSSSTRSHGSSRWLASKAAPPPTIELSPTREPTVDLQDEDPDLFETLTRIDRKVNLTERAIEKLMTLCEKESNSNLALRLAVEPGGCHGYQYNMNVVDMALEGEDGMQEDDYLFSHRLSPNSSAPANLLIDCASLPLLNLSTLDYATELIGSQFVVKENPNAKGGGCGCGVSWEPRDDLATGGGGGVQAEKSGPILDKGGIDIGEKGRSNRLGAL